MTTPQQPYPTNQPHGQQQWPAAPAKRRRVWPWVLLACVLVPVLGLVGCLAVISGTASTIEQARAGGTIPVGETFTYADGLALTVATPVPYTPANPYEVEAGNVAYESPVTVVNGTTRAVSAALISINVTVAGQPAPQVFGDATVATQDIPPGGRLVLPFRFRTVEGAAGDLQIAVRGEFNEPVFFTAVID